VQVLQEAGSCKFFKQEWGRRAIQGHNQLDGELLHHACVMNGYDATDDLSRHKAIAFDEPYACAANTPPHLDRTK
jgi:hypothetical protein